MKSAPSHYEIARHWHDIDKDFVLDLSRPACFACHYWNSPRDAKSIEEAWAKSGLERAHVTAKSIGGHNHPRNFLMLCGRCHMEAPMTSIPDVMLQWARTREQFVQRLVREATEALGTLGISETDLDLVAPSHFIEFLRAIKFDRHPYLCASFMSLVPAVHVLPVYLSGLRMIQKRLRPYPE
jgi:hypothetical protein